MNEATEQATTASRRWYLKNRERHCQRSKERYEKNKAERLKQIEKWAKANPSKIAESAKKYRVANREVMRQRCRNWYSKQTAESRERINAKRRAAYPKKRARHKAWWKQYYKENKAKLSLRILKRKALKKQASINLAGIENFVTTVRKSKSVACYYCGDKMPGALCHFDHIVPLAKGGQHSADNLCVSCPPCNLSKQDKPLNIWIKVGQQLLSL